MGEESFVAFVFVYVIMPNTSRKMTSAEADIAKLQASIDQTTIQRAAKLSMAEKLRMGADLYDEGIRWLRQIIKAEQPTWTDSEVEQELDRRRLIKRQLEEARIIRPCTEDKHN